MLEGFADIFELRKTKKNECNAKQQDDQIFLAELAKGAGTQFCPVAVEAFVNAYGKQEEAAAGRESHQLPQEAAKPATVEAQPVSRENAADSEKQKEGSISGSRETAEGAVELVAPPPVHFGQVRQFQEALRQAAGLRIMMVGGSADQGAVIVVWVQAQVALFDILRGIAGVEKAEEVIQKGKRRIVLTLKPFVED